MTRNSYIRVSVEDAVPELDGTYLTTLKFPNGTTTVKKVYFHKGDWKLRAGKKLCMVQDWFKRIQITEENYQELIKLPQL